MVTKEEASVNRDKKSTRKSKPFRRIRKAEYKEEVLRRREAEAEAEDEDEDEKEVVRRIRKAEDKEDKEVSKQKNYHVHIIGRCR